MIRYKAYIGATIACLLIFVGQLNAESPNPAETQKAPLSQEQSAIKTLDALVSQLTDLKKEIETRKAAINRAKSTEEKQELRQKLQTLKTEYALAEKNFRNIATGIDLDIFESKPEEKFVWQDELLSLIKPAVQEIKNLTSRPRKIEKLKREIAYYQNRLSVAREAMEHLSLIQQKIESPLLKKRIKKMMAEWEDKQEHIETTLSVAKAQLEDLIKEKKSFLDSMQIVMKAFFKDRGKNLLFAALSFVLVFIPFRFIYRLTPLYKATDRSLGIRLCDLLFHIITFFAAITALFMVLYASGDWLLLSLAIIFLIGIGWTAKQGLPRYWEQTKLLLNVGAVRENERIIYNGIPWMVKSINLYTTLSNPAFPKYGIRLPINDLVDMTSRPIQKNEPWFPCYVDDWVILADGVRGKIVSQNHEFVQLVLRGGAYKTYQTQDFLSNAPLNLSRNFRLKVGFGIDYKHQAESTTAIPDLMADYINGCIEKEGYSEDLLNLRVEFAAAAASSLDLVIITDFSGKLAVFYRRLERSVQRWAVDACNHYGWEIPFTQITVHSTEAAKV